MHIAGGDMNLYAYVANNPMDYTDPKGTSAAIQ
jgi:RHS repeat-associated protein